MAHFKQIMADGFVQLAVLLSILRMDLPQYLRSYSRYPEIQHGFMDSSLGLQLVDNYHESSAWVYPSKYIYGIEHIFNDVHRLSREPIGRRQHQVISVGLVTEGSNKNGYAVVRNGSLPSTSRASSGQPQMGDELSSEDMELIEMLWKQDMDMGVGKEMFDPTLRLELEKEREIERVRLMEKKHQLEQVYNMNYSVDAETGERIYMPLAVPGNVAIASSDNVLDEDFTTEDFATGLQYQSQRSLDQALEELNSLMHESNSNLTSDMVGNQALLQDVDLSAEMMQGYSGFAQSLSTNESGTYWNTMQEHVYGPSSLDLDRNMTNATDSLLLGLLDASDDLNMYMDTDDAFSALCAENNLSDDSAVSVNYSSSGDSWSDHHSVSSEGYDASDFGASGFTKDGAEPFRFYETDSYTSASSVNRSVSHNHTYGAPPGGVPHVRKMDMKVQKEPTRGISSDERRCKELNIPFSIDTIIDSPVEEFTKLMQHHQLSEEQTNLIRDIRRRGKNKAAAQNCRKKKMGELTELEMEIETLKSKRDVLLSGKMSLEKKTQDIQKHIDSTIREIVPKIRDDSGAPYDPQHFTLEISDDGDVRIAPTNSTNTFTEKSTKKRRREQ